MSRDDNANWVKAAIEENQLESMSKLAAPFAAFYQGLKDSGLPQEVCLQLTAAYIEAIVTSSIMKQAGQRG